MRTLIGILILVLSGLNLYAQSDNVDSLIKKINNDQLKGICHYVWDLGMNSSAGDSLIKLGEPITPELIPLLDSKEKGIIVHYILSNIWADTLMTTAPMVQLKKDSVLEYNYCGLLFFEKNGHMFTKKRYLRTNKKRWIEKLNN